jgi:hypothetical protein
VADGGGSGRLTNFSAAPRELGMDARADPA